MLTRCDIATQLQLGLPLGLAQDSESNARRVNEDSSVGLVLDEAYDYLYTHASFCHSAFPQGKPSDEHARVHRRNGRFAVTIEPTKIGLPGEEHEEVAFGVPYGTAPRLLTVWAATRIQETSGTLLEIGPIREFFSLLGRAYSGPTLLRMKDQLLRLAFARMTMVIEGSNADGVMNTSLFDGSVLEPGTLRHYKAGDLGKIQWPQALKVTDTMAATFRRHKVPIPTQRLRMVADSAMATDLFLYFCYSLPNLKDDEQLPFRVLANRFGAEGMAASTFRAKFIPAIRQAMKAYPEANISFDEQTGLILRPSPPADLRRAYFAGADLDGDQSSASGPTPVAKPKHRRRSNKRFNNLSTTDVLPGVLK